MNRAFLIAGLVLLSLWCAAVEPYQPKALDPVLEPWRWQQMEVLNGLGIRCVDQAPDGSFWFGCVGQLVSYDGWNVTKIPYDKTLESIVERRTVATGYAIKVLQDGSVLVAAGNSLIHWKDGTWSLIIDQIREQQHGTKIVQTENGAVWFRNYNRLWYLDRHLDDARLVFEGEEDAALMSFCLDQEGNAWFAHLGKKTANLVRIPVVNGEVASSSQWDRYPIQHKEVDRRATIATGPQGRIWYADKFCASGIKCFDPRKKAWADPPVSLAGRKYSSILLDQDGTVWAGGKNQLFAWRQSVGGRVYDTKTLGLPFDQLELYSFDSGELWFIFDNGKVYRLDHGDKRWQSYAKLHFHGETEDGTQWYLSERKYAVSYNPQRNEWLKYDAGDGFVEDPIRLHISQSGAVWATGSMKEIPAIARFDGQTWKRFEHPLVKERWTRGGICETSDGSMWFAAAEDLLCYRQAPDGDSLSVEYHSVEEIRQDIKWIQPTAQNSLWIGGSSSILEYAPDQKSLKRLCGIHDLLINASMVDQSNQLWVAENGSGIFSLEQDQWREIANSGAIDGDHVCNLVELDDGSVLVASDKGGSRFDGSTWTRNVFSVDFAMSRSSGFFRQAANRDVWINLFFADIRSVETRSRLEGGHYSTRYRFDRNSPIGWIHDHSQRVDATGNIYVSWAGRDFMDDTPPDELQYSWRVDGSGWSPFTYETGHVFVNLESGDHTLEVRVRDHDYNISPDPAVTLFSVALPIWRRAWFIGMVLFILGVTAAFIWTLIYFHDKRLKDSAKHLTEMDQMKMGFFTNISHEINTPLGLIKGVLERMEETDEDKEKLQAIAMRNVDRAITLGAQIMDMRKLEQGRVQIEAVEGDLAQHVEESLELFQPLAKEKNVIFSFEPSGRIMGWFDPDKLSKIVSNLVGNAFKYTPASGSVRVMLSTIEDEKTGRMLSLLVEDSGPGVEPEYLQRVFERFYRIPEKSIVDGSGIGLNLAKDLVDLWGGKISAESPVCPDAQCPGTRFLVQLPIDRHQIQNLGGEHGQPSA